MRLTPLVLALILSASAVAQTPLAVGGSVSGTLASGDADAYTLALGADQFVVGRADQRTVDVALTVTGPDGETVRTFDASARGVEPFQFATEAAGAYTVTVTPAGDGAGAYTLALMRAEPVATTPAGRVDQLFASRDHDGAPGALVAVVENGEILFENAYGTANLTHGVPMTLATRTNIGSTSKQFTAFALVLLAERGELSLDDDVREHIPELRDFGQTVTLRHLLTHTSGYREFLNTLMVEGRRLDEGDFIDRAEVIGIIAHQPALQNAPGAEFNYNNSGYALAALVVERVTGQPFPAWMAENVFEPLGMTDTVVRASPGTVVANSAQGYVPSATEGWREARDLGGAMGAGSIYTTVGDLARWQAHYAAPTLVSAQAMAQMTTPGVLTDGEATDYGLGLFIAETAGHLRIHHGGADAAHRSAFSVIPDLGIGVIVQTNSPADVEGLSRQTAQAFFPQLFETPDDAPEAGGRPDAVAFDDALFDDYAGRYALDIAPTFILAFRRDDAGGYLTQATGQSELEIVPTSDSTFVLTAVEAGLTFHRDADGVVRSITMHQNGDHRATRLDVEPMGEAPDLTVYTGRFFSDELETVYTLDVADGELVARHRRTPEPTVLRPSGEDAFIAGPGITLAFERDASGAVTAFTVDADRARGIRFERFE